MTVTTVKQHKSKIRGHNALLDMTKTQYDLMIDKMHKARKEEEKKTGRRMTIKERIDFCDNFEKNYYLNKEE